MASEHDTDTAEEVLDDEVDLTPFDEVDMTGAAPAPGLPLPRWRTTVSGLYELRGRRVMSPPVPFANGSAGNGTSASLPMPISSRVLLRESLRLDVDGRYPQMAASGTIYEFLTERTHWVARLTRRRDGSFAGPIWYKDGDVTSFPFTSVTIRATGSPFPGQRQAVVRFSAPGAATRVQTLRFVSQYFRPCEFEYDTVEGSAAVTGIETRAHPNCPSGLPAESLSIEAVFRRAGFNVSTSSGDGVIPLLNAGSNARWSDAEMHDAMQVYWSRFTDRPQWAMWTLFASLHDMGVGLGGVMFDDIGPNHRQGTAIFNDSFISSAPTGDSNAAAWIQRMKFWTAVHEMGHTFNLAHSWQKVHPPAWGSPWTPLTNEPDARSFMNYPYNVGGGQAAFFADFEYRFSDQELLFMRHAPERFVQHGNANWFDNHGFEQTRKSADPAFRLELRVNRDSPTFEFLEPAVIELKLTNVSGEPQLLEEQLLATADLMTVAVKREGRAARQYSPFAQNCWSTRKVALAPGESRYESLFIAAGKNGWDVAEPGRYVIQIALHLENEDVISTPLMLRIAPPRGYDEEYYAQDFFTEDVGRVLAFDGTRALDTAIDTLKEGSERFHDRSVALHAKVALGMPLTRNFKELIADPGAPPEEPLKFKGAGVQADEAKHELSQALMERRGEAASTLGHIDYAGYTEHYSQWLAAEGDSGGATRVRKQLVSTLEKRGVKAAVISDIKSRLADAGQAGELQDDGTFTDREGRRIAERGDSAEAKPGPAKRSDVMLDMKEREPRKSGKGSR
jgi:hypothetical protein